MSVIEVGADRSELTQRQRWSHYFVLIYAAIALLIGINLRDSVLNATVLYTDAQAGIRALYPANWLLDTGGDYVFRVRDMTQMGFKTTLQVKVMPVTANTSARNILDNLILTRQQTLAAFSVLARDSYTVRGDIPATSMTYTFVSRDEDPFLQGVPTVAEGIDVLIIEGGQAIVITFIADVDKFEALLPIFERFLNDLSF